MDSVLDTGDKIASIAGVVVGVAGLLVAFTALRLQRRESARDDVAGTRSTSFPRRVAIMAAGAALVCGTAVVLVPAPEAVSIALAGTAVAAVVIAIVALVRHRGSAPELPPAVRSLLSAQRSASTRVRYRFFEGHVPGLPEVHVTQRSMERGDGEDVDAPRRASSFAEALRAHRHVVLVGAAGGGKSTTAAIAVTEAADWWLSTRRMSAQPATGRMIPVLVAARALVGHEVLVGLSRWLSEQYEVNVSRETFLEPGRAVEGWVLVIDGLDEVTDGLERAAILRSLSHVVAESTVRLRFVVLTRPLPTTEMVEIGRGDGVGIYDLLPFDGREFAWFTDRWFAARQPAGTPAPLTGSTTAARFRQAVTTARLDHLVRSPLLATLSAVLFEKQADGLLPEGRPAIYETFVEHLMAGRDESVGLAVQLFGTRPSDNRTVEAAAVAVRKVLEVTADTDQAAARRVDLLDVAVHESAPLLSLLGFPAAPIGWPDRLRGVLLMSGLVVADGDGLTFVHESIAEYLASAVQVARFDLAKWRTRMTSPATRGAALFVLARLSDVERERVLAQLLRAGATLEAAHVLADGVPVEPGRRAAVLRRLYTDIERGHPLVVEMVKVAIMLSGDATVREAVVGIGDDPGTRPWLRARIARDLADLDPDGSTERLRAVMEDRAVPSDIRAWCARELLATEQGDRAATLLRFLWDRHEPPSLDAHAEDITSSLLGADALTEILADGNQDPEYRVNAARNLLVEAGRVPDRAVDTARETLAEISEDASVPGHSRLVAATILLSEEVEQGRVHSALRALAAEPAVPARDRVEAIRGLREQRAAVPGEVVVELFQSGVGEQDRRDLLAALLDDHSPDVADTLLLMIEQTELDARWRAEAAAELLRRGDHRVLGSARELIRDPDSDDYRAGRLILEIGANGGPDAIDALIALVTDAAAPDHRRHEAFAALHRVSKSRAAASAATVLGMTDHVPDALFDAAVTSAARTVGREGRVAVDALLKVDAAVGDAAALRSSAIRRSLRAAQVRRGLDRIATDAPVEHLAILGDTLADRGRPEWLRTVLLDALGRRAEPEVPALFHGMLDRLAPHDPLRPSLLRTLVAPPGRGFRFDVAERLLTDRPADAPAILALVPRTGEAAALQIVETAIEDDTLLVDIRSDALSHVCFWDKMRGRRVIERLLHAPTGSADLVLARAASGSVLDLLLFETIDEDLTWQGRLRAATHAFDVDQASTVDAVVRLGTEGAVTEEGSTRAVFFLLDREHPVPAAHVVRLLRARDDLDGDFLDLLEELDAAIERRRGT